MPGICREGLDFNIGHASPTANPFHRTSYKATTNTKVYVEGQLAIVDGDKTACGDPVKGKSSKVFVGGNGVHRQGDATDGHESWVPNAAASGSSKVSAG